MGFGKTNDYQQQIATASTVGLLDEKFLLPVIFGESLSLGVHIKELDIDPRTRCHFFQLLFGCPLIFIF